MIVNHSLTVRTAPAMLLDVPTIAPEAAMAASAQPSDFRPPSRGERRELDGRAGRLGYYVAGDGPPLLLIHSINAAGSAYEVKPIFEHAAGAPARLRRGPARLRLLRPLDRAPTTSGLFVDAVHDMLDAIAAEAGAAAGRCAGDLAELGVPGARGDRTAGARPRTLALVTPPASAAPTRRCTASDRATREVPGLYRLFTFPLWSQGFYNLLVEPAQHPLLPGADLGLQADRRRTARLRLPDHAPARGASTRPMPSSPAACSARTSRSVYQQLDDAGLDAARHARRLQGLQRGRLGADDARTGWSSPTTPARCPISSGRGVPGRLRAVPGRPAQASSSPSEPRSPRP